MRLLKILVCILLLALSSLALAEIDKDSELAKAGQNPIAKNPEATYLTLPLIYNANFRYGPGNNTQDELQFKPIIPYKMSNGYDLILRPILPLYYHQPSSGTGTANINGWGDMNPTAFLTPTYMKDYFIWGVGPNLFIPTASNKALGSGKWSLGPQVAFFYMPHNWVIGALTSNVWSFAGEANRSAVNQFSFQYFISYNFPKGWYLTSQPTVTANWKLNSNKWVLPFGIGGGRALNWGDRGINFAIETYYNVMPVIATGSKFTVQAKLEFLTKDH